MSRRDASPVGAAGPALPYPAVTLPELVLAAARRWPDAPAVRQWDESLTYRELVATASVLAGQLRELGVGPESRVGCCLGRRPTLLPAVLGVLLAGAAYVPLEQSHPGQRLRHLIADAGISVVVADQAGRACLSQAPVRFVAAPVPVDRPDAAAVPAGPATPNQLAHVIYTSGSTGRPKGVLTTHRNVVAFVTAFGRYTGANERMRSLGFASLGFDFVTKDLWVPLAHGGCIQLAGEADRRDPDRLARFVREHRVSWGGATPTVLALLDPADLPDWRLVFAGGEPVPAELVARWTAAPGGTSRRFLVSYGPTETTVSVTAAQLTGRPAGPVPIGRPLPNHWAYIVDERMRPVPPGVDGELLIGGPGLARGYLGAPGLTAQRFVADPFGDQPGATLYRTGDLARWLPDGQLAFRGRRDGQLKVRGQRIELGEVEAVLLEHPAVRQAAVVPAAEPGGGTRLVAFVVVTGTAGTAAADLDAIRLAATQLLTPAMVPDRLVRVGALPRTAAGKVDRSRLAALVHAAAGAHPLADHRPAAVRSSVDIVTAAWQRVLGGAGPRPTDDFLAAGGHSVAAMRLVTGLRDATGREVMVEDILTGRTVAGIAERLDRAPPAMPAAPPAGGRPPALSPGQRRLWFVDRLTPGSPANNIALAFRLDGPLEVGALRAALREIVAHHEVLRWRIVEQAGIPSPVCDPPGPPPLTVVDLTTVPVPDRDGALADRLAAGAAVSFDLATGPLWHVTLYQIGTDRHVLAGTWHHAVFDGWSKAVFVDELSAAYRRAIGQAADRPAADRQLAGFAEYVAWRTDRDARRGDADLAWWVEHLHGAPTTLDIPGDRPRPAMPTLHGGRVARSLPLPVAGALRRLGERLHVTTAAVLLAGFGVLLHRRTGRTDMVVGAVLADRWLPRWQRVIGYLVDIAPVRVRLIDPEPGTPLTFADLVHRCADEFHQAAAHPAAPLERVVAALDPPRDASRTPLVQVLFNVLNYPTPQPRLPGLQARPVPVTVPGAAFDLTLYVVERAGALALEAAYNADVYDQARIAALLDDAVLLLDELSDAPHRPVSAAAPQVAVAAVTAPPAAASLSGPGGAPSTPTQRLVAEVWAGLLGVPSVDIRENFFDLGGDSLTLLAARARLAALTGRELPVVELFRHPNVAALAAYMDGVGADLDVARANRRAVMRRERARRRSRAGPRPPA